MPYFTLVTVEENENGATNPTTGGVWDRFVRVRCTTGAQAEIHDDGLVDFRRVAEPSVSPGLRVEPLGTKLEPITTVLQTGETVDILLVAGLYHPEIGPALPANWPLHMDLSGEDEARLACRIVDPQWQAPALPYRAAYPMLMDRPHILVESDLGRFIVHVSQEHDKRQVAGADLRQGDYLWWTGYQRFRPYAFL